MPEIAYINGTFCDISEARVSINDRGFQFADSVYEVVVAYGKNLFRMAEHLARLRASSVAIDLDLDRLNVDFEAIIRDGLGRASFERTMIYIQVTRGVQPRSHIYQPDLTPTLVATFRPKPEIDPAKRSRGLSVVTVDDTRRAECSIKATSLLPNIVAGNRARRDGFDDAIFVGPNGVVREATAANIFAVRDGRLLTPVRDKTILHGVTLQYVLECAEQIGCPATEQAFTVDELESANEVFVSSTTMDVLAVTKVNGHSISDGTPGTMTQRLYETFITRLTNGD